MALQQHAPLLHDHTLSMSPNCDTPPRTWMLHGLHRKCFDVYYLRPLKWCHRALCDLFDTQHGRCYLQGRCSKEIQVFRPKNLPEDSIKYELLHSRIHCFNVFWHHARRRLTMSGRHAPAGPLIVLLHQMNCVYADFVEIEGVCFLVRELALFRNDFRLSTQQFPRTL